MPCCTPLTRIPRIVHLATATPLVAPCGDHDGSSTRMRIPPCIMVTFEPNPTERNSDDPAIATLWALRLLRQHGTSSKLLKRFENAFDGLRCALIPESADTPATTADLAELIAARHAAAERASAALPPTVEHNLALLRERIPLKAVEEQVLVARALFRLNAAWEGALLAVTGNHASDRQIATVLGTALGLPPPSVAHALRADGPLRATGLLELDPRLAPFEQRLTPLPGLPNALVRDNATTDDLFAFVAQRAAPGTLSLSAYPHLSKEIGLVQAFLSGSAACALPGVNILLHGAPGTGKTELVRALARSLGLYLYEVAPDAPADDDTGESTARLRNYRFLQQLLGRSKRTAVIFDEVEDVFTPERGPGSRRGIPKAAINRALESNPVPAFWVTNRIGQVDAAYRRRFDLIIKVDSPPMSVRRRLVESALGGNVREQRETVERLAATRTITPALVARARRVIAHAGSAGVEAAAHLELAVKGHLEASPADPDDGVLTAPRHFDLGIVNTSEPLAPVCATLERHRRGRLLLYGPPGTGKTAFARHLAFRLDRPLLVRRASDILSPWLGQSEVGAREIFAEARDEDAVLFLDEADGLLRDRHGALARWEGTVMAELLYGMEHFRGVFVCATNLLDALDPATLRRFTFKIEFRWLTAEQRRVLLEHLFAQLAAAASAAERADVDAKLRRLDNLAPGDFAVVAERQQLGMPFATLAEVVDALAAECRHKASERRPIGF